jgi:choline kinase
MLDMLVEAGVRQTVLVVGYRAEVVREQVGPDWSGMEIVYVENELWEVTNNVVSLHLAADRLDRDFLLLEGDLIFPRAGLERMLMPDSMAVDRFRPGMDGTVVDLDEERRVTAFYLKSTPSRPESLEELYKTVNIYCIRRRTFREGILPYLTELVQSGKRQVYYEEAFARAVAAGRVDFRAVSFADLDWMEIDTGDDLRRAEALFTKPRFHE